MLGEFPVVMNLIKEVPEAQEAKHQVDRLIEAIGPPHGVEHVREAIVMDKMQYDVASDEYREVLKERIMDQVEKYFMLIIFSLYAKQVNIIESELCSLLLSSTGWTRGFQQTIWQVAGLYKLQRHDCNRKRQVGVGEKDSRGAYQ